MNWLPTITTSLLLLWATAVYGATTQELATPTFAPLDLINMIANEIYPMVIPAVTVAAAVFACFWAYHKLTRSL